MKRKKLVIKPPKKRMHYALFAPNTPFKSKKVENKKAFKRKPRNQKDDNHE
jgi:hypothetical protein